MTRLRKRLGAHFALEWTFTRMRTSVPFEKIRSRKGRAAHTALVRPIARVHPLMYREVTFGREALATHLALELIQPRTRVNTRFVLNAMSRLRERLVALVALIRPFVGVRTNVRLENVRSSKISAAHVALVGPLVRMNS